MGCPCHAGVVDVIRYGGLLPRSILKFKRYKIFEYDSKIDNNYQSKAAMTVAEKCLALPEMVDKILSFLGKNYHINCLCINTE